MMMKNREKISNEIMNEYVAALFTSKLNFRYFILITDLPVAGQNINIFD